MLEHLFIRLRRGETQQNFNIWVFGEKDLARGSGLFVGQEGIAANHHFLTPTDVQGFAFIAGDYELEVFGKAVGRKNTHSLATIGLSIDANEAKQLRETDQGIYFDWGPDAERYQKKIGRRPPKEFDPFKFLETIHGGMTQRSSNLEDTKDGSRLERSKNIPYQPLTPKVEALSNHSERAYSDFKIQQRFRRPYQSSLSTIRVSTGSFIAPSRSASRATTSVTPSISNITRPGFTFAAQ